VAFLPGTPEFRPQPDEVADIIDVPLEHFLGSRSIRHETWDLGERKAVVPFYEFESHKIWGATAMVLAEFLALLDHPGSQPSL
jgi:hypothetical protein